ncbi:hypothetical protein ABEB36_008600 [Hypothenemus hampei]|uniref:Uncharacterized protein n=1 Tax=Hypothenemus hampei TaxID=57062 RepID=A0ABD1EN11_HYPHA
MRLILVVLLVFFTVLIQSTPVTEDGGSTSQSHYKIADKDLLEKQKKVLSLFKHINQPCYDEDHLEILKTFRLEDNKDLFNDTKVVETILEYYTNGFILHKGEIFSVFTSEHLDQAIALFNLFYYAKDFDTFYKTAVVARHWVNEGLFLYTYSVAIVHRSDCYGVILPPIYEIYPNYFFSAETIHEAYRYKQSWNSEKLQQSSSWKYPGYTIHSNYSGHYLNLHPEQSLSYYLEDIGINSFYYTYFLYYPFWLNGTRYGLNNDRRGELYHFIQQQLFTRFYLERLSNGFGEIPVIDFNEPVETPYYPSLQYLSGLPFPERPQHARLSDYFYNYGYQGQSKYSLFQDYSRRIADAIDRGYVYDKHGQKVELFDEKHGYDYLSNLLQANPDSPDNYFYGPWLRYGRHLLGYSFTPLSSHKLAPSALEHLETTLRDPGFYQLYKHLLFYYTRYQSRLAPYTREQLIFPGVSIEKVSIDRLVTYFEDFFSDISQAVFYSEDELKQKENGFFVRAKQHRLNHKPFTYKIQVNSDKETRAVVKIFIGPKYDEFGRAINISHNRLNFFELDKFVYDLKNGENVIKRSSYESKFFSPDKTGFYDLYKKVLEASNDQGEFTINGQENYFTFPQRYVLPKGNHGGFPVQFYVIVYPYKAYSGNKPQEWKYYYPRPGVGGPYIDEYPLLYPFDRPIKYGQVFSEKIPNSYFYETKIYHRRDVNSLTSEE